MSFSLVISLVGLATGLATVYFANRLEQASKDITHRKLRGDLNKRAAARAEFDLLRRARIVGALISLVMAALLAAVLWEADRTGDWGGWTPYHLFFFAVLLLVTFFVHIQLHNRFADARRRVTELS